MARATGFARRRTLIHVNAPCRKAVSHESHETRIAITLWRGQIMQHTFRITYVRTSYMEMELGAEDCRDAERRFEAIALADPLVCERGNTVIGPHYRIVDVVESDNVPASAPSHRELMVA